MLSNLKRCKNFGFSDHKRGSVCHLGNLVALHCVHLVSFPKVTSRTFSSDPNTAIKNKDLFTKRAEHLFRQGETLMASSKYQEAELPLLSCRQVAKILQDTSLRGKVAGMLGYSYHQRELVPSAETYLKESVELLHKDKASSTFVALMTSYLAEIYSKTNRLSEATQSSKQALDALLNSGEVDSSLVASMKSNIAGYLMAEEKYNEAERFIKEALTYFDATLGKHNPVTKKCAVNLVKILKAGGKEDEIKALQQRWVQETEEKTKVLQDAAKQKFEEKWIERLEEAWKAKEIKRFDPPGFFLPEGMKKTEQAIFTQVWNNPQKQL